MLAVFIVLFQSETGWVSTIRLDGIGTHVPSTEHNCCCSVDAICMIFNRSEFRCTLETLIFDEVKILMMSYDYMILVEDLPAVHWPAVSLSRKTKMFCWLKREKILNPARNQKTYYLLILWERHLILPITGII